VTSQLVVDAARARGAEVCAEHAKEAAPALIAGMARPGDLVLTMGAGDVTELGPRILARLAERSSS
jgi:UDP-N-acetylmuramate--alanine ligase